MRGGAEIPRYIAQHSLDQLDPKSTVLGLALESYPGDSSDAHEASMRRHLAQFGLAGDLPKQRIGTLSGLRGRGRVDGRISGKK